MNIKSFIVATVLDKDEKYLKKGQIPISFCDDGNNEIKYDEEYYVMIESEVYFEPYFHTLQALQCHSFPDHLAMSKYIVRAESEPAHPSYLDHDSYLEVKTKDSWKLIKVLQHETWPTKEELSLNESQYVAYRLALTHEFAVIQGPPGTGKTFLGVKVAETLIKNISETNDHLLIICYTNHALDQFLESLLPITKSIVRIGSQSRNEKLEPFNITNLRRLHKNHLSDKLFFETKQEIENIVDRLQNNQNIIDTLDTGILRYEIIREHLPEIEVLRFYYKEGDPIKQWLFERRRVIDFKVILLQFSNSHNESQQSNQNQPTDQPTNYNYQYSFSLIKSENIVTNLISKYNNLTENPNDANDVLSIIRESMDLMSYIQLFREMSVYRKEINKRSQRKDLEILDPTKMSIINRWILYFKWIQIIEKDLYEEINDLQKLIQIKKKIYEELRMLVDTEILQDVLVIGMTTTGAARLQKLLREIKPSFVLVEEAAEVLEQHIVTCLTKYCKHLILIGDHQQLRPSAAHVRLAKHFNMEISLFERMILNGIHNQRLNVQHRMRPELALLISPHIYADLANHPSVKNFPDVRGMTKNLFFFTHNYTEEEFDDNTSHKNFKEADLTLRLANYIMQQGYDAGDVTILATYSGQMFYMRNERKNYAHLLGVKITVVDNYQGEESKIILLSLVRNNNQNKIGFLGNKNRICVALSRAREGFYIFGNIDILRNDKNGGELWRNIANTLEENSSLGTALTLKCENHPDNITHITTPTDFDNVPEGGCLKSCGKQMPCGHLCPLVCHGYDQNHINIKCRERCQRLICELQHDCPLLCMDECRPCEYLVEKNLPCGHMNKLKCYLNPADPEVKCTIKVTITFPDCQHEGTKLCHENMEIISCEVPCKIRVESCGHECRLNCHVNNDPDHENYDCMKPCARAKKGCTANLIGDRGEHQCLKKCYETCDDCNVTVMKKRSSCKHSQFGACSANINEIPCREKCARLLPCGHFCKKKCSENCGDCKQMVKKIIPSCKHEVYIECMNEATRDFCKQKCEQFLPCGHPCLDRCNKICDQSTCTEIIPTKSFDSPCGHKVRLPCYEFSLMSKGNLKEEMLLKYCTEPCLQLLECEHLCHGTCSQCLQGRLHTACKQICHQLLICGHSCEENCNQVCPPCKKQCVVRCQHSRCNQLCGAPCVTCQEPCKRICPHGSCDRRCGEPCSRPPCNEPCELKLVCGHACRGFCGEPCPGICKKCAPETFPKDFLGDDYDDNVRFIQLQDCGHVLDQENLDNLMMSKTETVKVQTCPFCRQPIITTYRYKDIVNRIFKMEINPIKDRVYGNKTIILNKKKELLDTIARFKINHIEILKGNLIWKKAFQNIQLKVQARTKTSLLQLNMQSVYLDILNIIAEYYKEYTDKKITELKDELHDQINMICKFLISNVNKLSQQQQKDIGNEIKRLHAIIKLSECLQIYHLNNQDTTFMKLIGSIKEVVLTWKVYEEDKALKAFGQIKYSEINLIRARQLVVKAIGLKAGHWYKCPNGHFYCIGECGGAMQISKCIECGVPIGGQQHRLLPGNDHAGEMDGSKFSAWSEEYNNMANFDLE